MILQHQAHGSCHGQRSRQHGELAPRGAPTGASRLLLKPISKKCRLLCASAGSSASPVIEPALKEAAAFAPATVANLGPGYDWMGCAVEV